MSECHWQSSYLGNSSNYYKCISNLVRMEKETADLWSSIQSFLEIQEELFGTPEFESISLQELNLTDAKTALSGKVDPGLKQSMRVIATQIASESSSEDKENSEIDDIMADPKVLEFLKSVSTLSELKSVCEQAPELKTELPDTNLVFGSGMETADLMIIGEAPGAEEDRLGEPFVGRSGQLLTKILEAINFSRDKVYIANIMKHRPPNNETPSARQRAAGLPYLLRQIELVNPRLILCLGKSSSDALLNSKQNLADLRGKFIPFMQSRELLVTYHPAVLLRNPHLKRDTWEDVQLLRKRYDELGCKP